MGESFWLPSAPDKLTGTVKGYDPGVQNVENCVDNRSEGERGAARDYASVVCLSFPRAHANIPTRAVAVV